MMNHNERIEDFSFTITQYNLQIASPCMSFPGLEYTALVSFAKRWMNASVFAAVVIVNCYSALSESD